MSLLHGLNNITGGLNGLLSSSNAAFSPSQLTGLVELLDSRFGVSQSSGAVSAWADQSGHGVNVSLTTGSVAYSANGGVNGLPKLTFNSNSTLSVAASPVAPAATKTVFAILQTSDITGGGVLSFNTSPSSNFYYYNDGNTSTYLWSDAVAVVNVSPDGPPDPSKTHLLMWQWQSGIQILFTLDGVPPSIITGGPGADDANPAKFVVGNTGSSIGFIGDIYQIAVCSGLSPTQDKANMLSYFLDNYR